MGKCKHCGQEIRENYTFENSQKLRNVATAISPSPPAGSPGFSARRETPAYLPSRETHLDLPLSQAYAFGRFMAPIGFVIGAVGGSVFAIGLDLLMAGMRDTSLTTWGYVGIIGLCGLGGGVIAFFWEAKEKFPERLERYDALLYKIEEATGKDIDGDGYIGQPEAPHRVEVELRRNGKPWKFESLEVDPDKLISLARLVANGQSFAERTASDCGISRKKFNGLRDKFVSRGLATWKGEPGSTEGLELTDDGVDTIAEIATTPLPRSYRQGENYGDSTHARSRTHVDGSNYERFEHIER